MSNSSQAADKRQGSKLDYTSEPLVLSPWEPVTQLGWRCEFIVMGHHTPPPRPPRMFYPTVSGNPCSCFLWPWLLSGLLPLLFPLLISAYSSGPGTLLLLDTLSPAANLWILWGWVGL